MKHQMTLDSLAQIKAGRENPLKRVRTIIIGPCSKIALFFIV